MNQIKKDADAASAYALSEGLWYLSRSLPENHAIMVCLGEGLMPKAGETPEMGSNPQIGFGRVYARPEVARTLDRQVVRLLNDPAYGWDGFYGDVKDAGITVWGAAIDTLENTSRFAKGSIDGSFIPASNIYAVNLNSVILSQTAGNTGFATLNFDFQIEFQLDAAGLPLQATLLLR